MHSLLAAALLSASTGSAGEVPAAVVLPPVADAADTALALVIQDRASALLTRVGGYNLVHAKQVVSMAERHGSSLAQLKDPVGARAAAERLGTKRFTYAELARGPDGWILNVSAAEVGSARQQTATLALKKGAAVAVRDASAAIAETLLALDGATPPNPLPAVQPDTDSDVAMRRYASCYATVIRQPISIEAPSLLHAEELKAAQSACEEAVAADPHFTAAWAALSLARALAGEDGPAVDALAHVKGDGGFIPLAWVARFWLVTRYQSTQGGALVLQQALQKNPGFLLGRGYLAELFNAQGKQAEAADAWRQYLALCPSNPYILTRMAYTLSRLGNAPEAVVISEKAVAFDPDSLELKLELASRYVDARAVDKAADVLGKLASQPATATPEVFLRLGYVQLLRGDFDKAEASLSRSVKGAGEPALWRTRARGTYDLGLVALKRGNKEQARGLLLQAVSLGLKPRPATDDEKALVALAKPSELSPPGQTPVRETSPFVLDSGEIAPEANRPSPPKGFEAVTR
jgi:tetratricopeptide (TPR) repeat protein